MWAIWITKTYKGKRNLYYAKRHKVEIESMRKSPHISKIQTSKSELTALKTYARWSKSKNVIPRGLVD